MTSSSAHSQSDEEKIRSIIAAEVGGGDHHELAVCVEPGVPAEPSVEDVIGDFDENQVLHNETEKAYTLPDIGAFAAYFPATGDLATGISVELHDHRNRRGLLNWFKYDLFISEQRLGLAVGRKLIPVVDVTFSAVYSRDFDRNEDVWGFSFGLVKF